PRSRLSLWAVIEALVAEGTTVLLTTQYLDEADRLADEIAVIDHGRLIADGRALEALASMSDEPPAAAGHDVTLGVRDTHGVIVEAVRRLGDAGIEVEDLSLRRPTLDDVFLALTGHAAVD